MKIILFLGGLSLGVYIGMRFVVYLIKRSIRHYYDNQKCARLVDAIIKLMDENNI